MKSAYNRIERYDLSATLMAPLHIGAGDGSESILLHPVTKDPFIQATGLCGAFRDTFRQMHGDAACNSLFGSTEEGNDSCIRFTDGIFEPGTITVELRPRVAIDPETGTVNAKQVKGTDKVSGTLFETEYLGAGARFTFRIDLFSDTSFREELEEVLASVNTGQVQLGGLKSIGCGYFRLDTVKHRTYCLDQKDGLRDWMEDVAPKVKLTLKDAEQVQKYVVKVEAKTTSELQVRARMTEDLGNGKNGAVNIRNAEGFNIIPGSALKGVLRSKMEMIAQVQGKPADAILHAFGSAGESEGDTFRGNLLVQDSKVGDKATVKQAKIRNRVKIDKFTGGAMNRFLVSEKNAHGDVLLEMSVADDAHADTTMELLLFALRDLAAGLLTIGSGSSIGKGFLDIETVTVTKKNTANALVLDFTKGTILDEDGILKSLKEGE